jgi:IS30 family transposase
VITLGTSTLSRFQRGALAQLVSEGHHTYQDMADALGVAKSTISYELDRVKPYDPELAQQDADHKRRACGRHSILTPSLKILFKAKKHTVYGTIKLINHYIREQS